VLHVRDHRRVRSVAPHRVTFGIDVLRVRERDQVIDDLEADRQRDKSDHPGPEFTAVALDQPGQKHQERREDRERVELNAHEERHDRGSRRTDSGVGGSHLLS